MATKELKLNRTDHINLRRIQEGQFPIGSNPGDIYQKFVIYGLVNSHTYPGQQSCTYLLSKAGKEYLEAHPALPPYKMTDKMASEIVHLLGNEGIECAPPFSVTSSIRELMLNQFLIEPVWKDGIAPAHGVAATRIGYKLTQDGADAFNAHPVGKAYNERVEEKQKRDQYSQLFDLTKPAKTLEKQSSSWYKEKAKYMRKKGLAEYADQLEGDAQRKEVFERLFSPLIGTEFEIPSTAKILSLTDGRPWSIEITGKESDHSFHIRRCDTYVVQQRDQWGEEVKLSDWEIGTNVYDQLGNFVSDDKNRKYIAKCHDAIWMARLAIRLNELLHPERQNYSEIEADATA